MFNSTENKDLNESLNHICFTVTNKHVSELILESMFGSACLVSEQDESDKDDVDKFSAKDAVSYV